MLSESIYRPHKWAKFHEKLGPFMITERLFGATLRVIFQRHLYTNLLCTNV